MEFHTYVHDYKLEFCGNVSSCLGFGNFRRVFGLVDAFTIGLSASIGGLGNLQNIYTTISTVNHTSKNV